MEEDYPVWRSLEEHVNDFFHKVPQKECRSPFPFFNDLKLLAYSNQYTFKELELCAFRDGLA